VSTLKRTWGESIIGYYGVGIASFLCGVPGIALIVVGVVLMGTSAALGMLFVLLGVVALVITSLVFGVLSSIYRTALYHFATTGSAPNGFQQADLMGAFH
jgi:hypothetical protein